MRGVCSLGYFNMCGNLAQIKGLLSRGRRKKMHGARNNPCPSGLVACAEPSSAVAMEVLIKQQVVPPKRVLLKLAGSPIDGPLAIPVFQKDARLSTGYFRRHLVQVHLTARPGGTLNHELIAVEEIILEQRADDERIEGRPNGPAPVRVSSKHC